MAVCSSCLRKAKRIEKQRQTLVGLRKSLAEARARIQELEDAIRAECDYADVCEHSPALEALARH